ncbi:MAG TPA: peptide deformylase [Acidimicrobiales bacterium]
MPARPVVLLPDKVLSRPAAPVDEVDAAARGVAGDLLDTMRAANHSVGIAAPQIGVSLAVFVVDVSGHTKARACHGEVVLFNPEVVSASRWDVGREGCMSVPDLTGDVKRAKRVVVRGLDMSGNERVIETDAFEARAMQHEIDHLHGRLFLDRVVSADRIFRRKVYR